MAADKKVPPKKPAAPPAAAATAAAAAAKAKPKTSAPKATAGKGAAAPAKGGGGGASASSVKHLMRGMHMKKSLFNVYVACGLSLTSAMLFYVLHNRRHQNIYAEFWENYDADEAFNRMMEGGYLQSCPPPPPPPPPKKK